MISLGLSSADLAAFQKSLITGYNMKTTVQILDLEHKYITDASDMLQDGQVNHTFWEPISYSATLTLLDPDNLTGFDTDSPSDNALYADRMIKIVISIYSELLPRWVDVPVFCGPVTKVSRDDAILSVECQGKESLAATPAICWSSRTYWKGTLITSVVKDVMKRFAGETKFDFPNWTAKLPKNHSVYTETIPWQFARSVQGSRHYRQLFYDGRGVLRFRSTPTGTMYTFGEPALLSVPKLEYDTAAIKNAAYVKGAKPEKKPQIKAWRFLPAGDASSPQRLGRNGVRRILAEIIEDSTLTTQAQADRAAEDTLASISTSAVGFDFDAFPIYHLEPGDVFHLQTRDVSMNLRLTEFSIPLKAGNPMSVGTNRKVSINRARLRRK